MNVFDNLWSYANGLTDSIITDVNTAIMGCIALLFILAGINLLFAVFNQMSLKNSEGSSVNLRDDHEKGSFDWDYNNASYRTDLGSKFKR